MIEVSRRCGLSINKAKCATMKFNDREGIIEEEIEGIKLVNEIKYLGVKICDERNLFKEQREEVMKKAHRMTSMTYVV